MTNNALFGLFFLAIAVLSVAGEFTDLRQWWRQRRSASWPWAKIVVESGKTLKVQPSGGGTYWELAMKYSYAVEGRRYLGTYKSRFAKEREAEDFLQSLRELPPPARYQPGKPGISVVDPHRDASLGLSGG